MERIIFVSDTKKTPTSWAYNLTEQRSNYITWVCLQGPALVTEPNLLLRLNWFDVDIKY